MYFVLKVNIHRSSNIHRLFRHVLSHLMTIDPPLNPTATAHFSHLLCLMLLDHDSLLHQAPFLQALPFFLYVAYLLFKSLHLLISCLNEPLLIRQCRNSLMFIMMSQDLQCFSLDFRVRTPLKSPFQEEKKPVLMGQVGIAKGMVEKIQLRNKGLSLPGFEATLGQRHLKL